MTASSVPRERDGKDRTRLTGLPLIFLHSSRDRPSQEPYTTVAFLSRYAFVFLLMSLTSGACAGANDSLPPDTSAAPLRIAQIHYNGNRVTKEYVIKTYTGLDTGMMYDSLKIRKAKQRLEATNMFLKVAILRINKKEGIHLYIVVKEPSYLSPYSIDFTPQFTRYGQSGTWYCPIIGAQHSNFRGRMESIRFSLRFLEWQALWPPSCWWPDWSKWRTATLTWSKPLLPSKYSLGFGAFGENRPDNALRLDRLEYGGLVSAGKKFFERSKAYCSVIPDYQRTIIRLDSSRVDTTHYYQAFTALGWITDRRSSGFDPDRGWSIALETRSNVLYHEETTPCYVQFSSDFKVYHPGFFEGQKSVYRLRLVSRTNDAGIQNRLTLGGYGSVRGYSSGGIDLQSTANHSVLFSWEYRFPIYHLPPVISRFLGSVSDNMSDCAPRIDGALIVDYGRVTREWGGIAATDSRGYRSGADFGFALRFMEPVKRLSGCMDIVWAENLRTGSTDFYPSPYMLLSLELPF
jgi:outer membrane protein assembly factor BamA